MTRYLCIHCHFYQPPRENPWLEHVEYQASAYPYHDWNEKISAECYGPNTLSRLLDREGYVVELINNYAKISFNFGPTLLSWMERQAPDVYAGIIEADALSQKHYGGHGSAIAQVYNHMILPLANRRDKETQVRWGIRDFERRFGRYPESMWLAETAVDYESLEILAEHGMKYVILAPRQASTVRDLHGKEWRDVSHERIDPRHPYMIRLDSGREIAAFFYDGSVSQAVAFEGLLHNGQRFDERLMGAFGKEDGPQLVHIATDGETYGHHHRHGEMALSYVLAQVKEKGRATLTNYGQYLALFPPSREARIFENSSWSCVHGIERWRANCGCNTGARNTSQSWRTPIRAAFDGLRDELTAAYEAFMKSFDTDPWRIRDEYIDVIFDRDYKTRFLDDHFNLPLSKTDEIRILAALEMQRHLLLMYTSCAWFFDDVSGLETIQNLKYAYRAMQLSHRLFLQDGIEERFRQHLALAVSNDAKTKNGLAVYEQCVLPAKVNLRKVTAHHAMSSLFDAEKEPIVTVYCYDVRVHETQRFAAGRARMILGHAEASSLITGSTAHYTFGVIHLGDHNISAAVKAFEDEATYLQYVEEIHAPFARGEFAEAIIALDKILGDESFSLGDLFRDDQKRILDIVLASSLTEVEAGFRQHYNANYPLMCYLLELEATMPQVYRSIAQFMHNAALYKELKQPLPSGKILRQNVREAERWGLHLDTEGIARAFEIALDRLLTQADSSSESDIDLQHLLEFVRAAKGLPFDVDLSHATHRVYQWCHDRSLQRVMGRELLEKIADELKVRMRL